MLYIACRVVTGFLKQAMNMSYRELSVIGVAVTTAAVMSWFFAKAWALYQAGDPRIGDLLWLVIPVVVMTVIIEIVIESNLAIWLGDQRVEDERDHLFSLRGERVAGYVMQVGVFGSLSILLFRDAMDLLDNTSLFAAVIVLIGFLTLSEITRCCVQVFHYRRGF